MALVIIVHQQQIFNGLRPSKHLQYILQFGPIWFGGHIQCVASEGYLFTQIPPLHGSGPALHGAEIHIHNINYNLML